MEMLKSQKSKLTCSFCSRIFKDPICRTYGDSICREHLKERDVVKQNKIKFKACSEEFGVKENHFKSNGDISKLIESQCYLNKEEMSLKHELEESIQKFFTFYDEFVQNRTNLDMDVYNHFDEIRFKIDEHRERIKEKIDDIALEMIDKVTKHEEKFLKI
jgi:hypothetical protein